MGKNFHEARNFIASDDAADAFRTAIVADDDNWHDTCLRFAAGGNGTTVNGRPDMTTHRRYRGTTLPRLSSTLTSCVRWRRKDLEDLLRKQLELMSADFAPPRNRIANAS